MVSNLLLQKKNEKLCHLCLFVVVKHFASLLRFKMCVHLSTHFNEKKNDVPIIAYVIFRTLSHKYIHSMESFFLNTRECSFSLSL